MMKPIRTVLAVVAAVGLTAPAAQAGAPLTTSVSTALVSHCGCHAQAYGYQGPVAAPRTFYGYPAILYPFPRHPATVYPPIRRVYGYHYYRPHHLHGGVNYYGRGFGVSIGF